MFGLLRRAAPDQFPGGLKLDSHKLSADQARIQLAPVPSRVILPLSQHIGAPAQLKVEVGQRVLRGQTVATADGYVSAPIHASTSGRVVSIGPQPVPHPSGLSAPAIVIEADGLDEAPSAPEWVAQPDYRSLDRAELRQRVRQAGIVGLGGAAFPSAVKLNPGGGDAVDTLILNGAECEPYISCDQALMAERAADIVAGAELIRYAIQARDCIIGVEDNKPEGIAALRAALRERESRAIEVRVVPTRYPQGGEKQLVQTLTGREVPSEGLPLDIGIVVHNVGTAIAVWQALTRAEPLISRVVTVTGNGIAKPANLEVRIGTPVAELIAHCGGYAGPRGRLIMGGPMMGFALSCDTVPVVKATNCILVAAPEDVRPVEPAKACIRCGECAEVCPAGLLPQQLYWHARGREFEKAQALNLFDCIECGCCAQVCPSHIPLVQYYRYAKTGIFQAEQERRKSDIARTRHEFRQGRLEREKQEKEAARQRKRESLQQREAAPASPAPAAKPAGNDAIAQAIAKAKLEKARRLARDTEDSATDPVAAAIARAKAKKAAQDERPITQAADDPVADAIALAKARKAEQNPLADDPAAAAIARAKANKAAQRSTAEDPATQAIARALARKAARADSDAKPAGDDDPVAAAIARAKARKAARNSDPDA